jgi:hypothetical protein
MPNLKVNLYFECEIIASVDYCIQNDGIGNYEYFGFKGNDRGEDYILLENISIYSSIGLTDKNKSDIENHLENILNDTKNYYHDYIVNKCWENEYIKILD